VRARGGGDPFWMFAKFNSTSANGEPIRKGDRIFYYPRAKAAYVGAEAERRAGEFQAARFDEAQYNGSW
jgi:hypothetical protein